MVHVATVRRSRCQSGSRFFGLRPGDKEQLILEPAFLLMYYGGFTYSETYSLPVPYKRWFIDRIVKELNKGKGGDDGGGGGGSANRALHNNSPEVRQLMGLDRTQSPSRLRRFT